MSALPLSALLLLLGTAGGCAPKASVRPDDGERIDEVMRREPPSPAALTGVAMDASPARAGAFTQVPAEHARRPRRRFRLRRPYTSAGVGLSFRHTKSGLAVQPTVRFSAGW